VHVTYALTAQNPEKTHYLSRGVDILRSDQNCQEKAKTPGDLTHRCTKYRHFKGGRKVQRATYCAIVGATIASTGEEESAPGDLLRP
jgi:hypothetical protein